MSKKEKMDGGDSLKDDSYSYQLHSSYVSMRKQILNLTRGYNNYEFEDILPNSFLPVKISKPFNKNGKSHIIGKSYVQADLPFILRPRVHKFEVDDATSKQQTMVSNHAQRLTRVHIKHGNFLLFENPSYSLCSFLPLFTLFFLICHIIVTAFEFFGYPYAFLMPFDWVNNILWWPFSFLVCLTTDLVGILGLFFKSYRLVSYYTIGAITVVCVSVLFVDKYVSFARIFLEIVGVSLMYLVRGRMCHTWFSTSTLE